MTACAGESHVASRDRIDIGTKTGPAIVTAGPRVRCQAAVKDTPH